MATASTPKKVAIAGAGPGGLSADEANDMRDLIAARHAADADAVASGRAARRA